MVFPRRASPRRGEAPSWSVSVKDLLGSMLPSPLQPHLLAAALLRPPPPAAPTAPAGTHPAPPAALWPGVGWGEASQPQFKQCTACSTWHHLVEEGARVAAKFGEPSRRASPAPPQLVDAREDAVGVGLSSVLVPPCKLRLQRVLHPLQLRLGLGQAGYQALGALG